MVGIGGRWPQRVSYALALVGGVFVTQLMSGCATSQAVVPTADSSVAVVTPSDEPEVRRRARLRLELASSYFENGQTAVALDEVKQALVIDPSYADAFNLRGLIYMRLNDVTQADDSFRRALAVRPDPNVLHNHGWLLCQQQKFVEADQQFAKALANPTYVARGKTWMARGLCQSSAGQYADAEQNLLRAYELDAANPVVAYHLASLMLRRDDARKAQFYIRRLNNGEFSNAESLWLGIKIERSLGESIAMRQLAEQLRKRFPESRERSAFERGAFDE